MSNDPPHEADQDTAAIRRAEQAGWTSGTCQPTAVTEALTRLRAQHPQWRVYQVSGPDFYGWCAYCGEPGDPGEQFVLARSLPALEVQLAGR